MDRREFLRAGAGAAASAMLGQGLLAANAYAADAAEIGKGKRVGLIGSGWYGKVDVLRLIQVAPVEVVSVCDVDRKMAADAAEIIASRQVSKKTPRVFHDYREMLGAAEGSVDTSS